MFFVVENKNLCEFICIHQNLNFHLHHFTICIHKNTLLIFIISFIYKNILKQLVKDVKENI